MIYKILTHEEWVRARDVGEFTGSAIDLRDGYIHFSSVEQLRETARLHFSGVQDLVVLEVREEDLGAALRWEPSRGGILFPHLYGVLSTATVAAVYEAPLDDVGTPRTGFLD